MINKETNRARLWIPIAVLAVLAVLALFMMQSKVLSGLDEISPGTGQTTREIVTAQLESGGLEVTDDFLSAVLSIGAAIGAISIAFVYPLAASAIGALIGLLVCNPIFGVKIGFRPIFASFLYSALLPLLFYLVETLFLSSAIPAPLGIHLYDVPGAALCGFLLYYMMKKAEPETKQSKLIPAAAVAAVCPYGLMYLIGAGITSCSSALTDLANLV